MDDCIVSALISRFFFIQMNIYLQGTKIQICGHSPAQVQVRLQSPGRRQIRELQQLKRAQARLRPEGDPRRQAHQGRLLRRAPRRTAPARQVLRQREVRLRRPGLLQGRQQEAALHGRGTQPLLKSEDMDI